MKIGGGEACPLKIDLFEVRGLVPNPLNKPKNSPRKLKIALRLLAPGGRDICLDSPTIFVIMMVQDCKMLDMSNREDED